MADSTQTQQPGMLPFSSSSGCKGGTTPTQSVQKPKKRAFYLVRMKPLKEPLANNNNNVSFVIHCHIGKEIKHICSNCSRAEEAPDAATETVLFIADFHNHHNGWRRGAFPLCCTTVAKDRTWPMSGVQAPCLTLLITGDSQRTLEMKPRDLHSRCSNLKSAASAPFIDIPRLKFLTAGVEENAYSNK
uniref:Uncharacterized protein n=1 Tax=Sphaerodactylus townsendi TaxID=933632 RepID=A0ACB8FCT0_9SAUR